MEEAGNNQTDSSGNGYTMALINGPVLATAQFGSGRNFAPTNDYARFSSSAINLNEGTFTMWINPDTAYDDNTQRALFDSDGARHATAKRTANDFWMYNDGRSTFFDISAVWTQSTWQWVVFVYNKTGNVQKLYWNGDEVTSASSSGTWGSTSLGTYGYVGNNAVSKTLAFDGTIDEVVVYDRVLTAVEIKQIYAMQRGGYGVN
jgi:hypothetical protein